MSKKLDRKELYFLKYRVHRKVYLHFIKDIIEVGIPEILEHENEFYYLAQYKEYGPVYLEYLRDSIDLNLYNIIDVRKFNEKHQRTLLKWMFMDINRIRRNENN